MIAWLNDIIKSIGDLASYALNLLPNSPFQFDVSSFSSWLGTINYFIPVSDMAGIFAVYLPAVLAYYVIRILLRWTKVGD